MPWSAADAESHTAKASSDRLRELWAHVANAALAHAQAKGVTFKEAEASAIRQANAVVANTARPR